MRRPTFLRVYSSDATEKADEATPINRSDSDDVRNSIDNNELHLYTELHNDEQTWQAASRWDVVKSVGKCRDLETPLLKLGRADVELRDYMRREFGLNVEIGGRSTAPLRDEPEEEPTHDVDSHPGVDPASDAAVQRLESIVLLLTADELQLLFE